MVTIASSLISLLLSLPQSASSQHSSQSEPSGTGRLYPPAHSYPMASYSLQVLVMTCKTLCPQGLCTWSLLCRDTHSLSFFAECHLLSETLPNHLHSPSWYSLFSFPALFFSLACFTTVHSIHFICFYLHSTGYCFCLFTAAFLGSGIVPGT